MPMFESFAKFFANLSPRSQRVQDHRSAVQPGQPSTPPRSRPGRNPITLGSDDTQPEAIPVRNPGTTAHPEVCIYPYPHAPMFAFIGVFLYDLQRYPQLDCLVISPI